ncbi:uncharacterized protein LOC127845544 [Dreissena polymorpha]|uniref:Uncharacterized protein n=1 Tax=Dreissena polymorpha TaxID=45954 RepID=A0A9D4EFN1_DREPO|nr:uncharacterized protein LOC127845544 [Dreissena polymorpha]KAH3778778.1 hypothetical protein DPMN_180249 [Dreissena polymorpha]
MATLTKEQKILWQQGRHHRKKSDHVYRESPELARQQALLRKQHERLEMEKKYLKENSYLSRDRQMLTDNAKSSSSHTRPDVKSRLFDFERSTPRSRRQLQETGNVSATSRGVTPQTSQELEAGQTPTQDVVDVGTGNEAFEQVPSASATHDVCCDGGGHSEANCMEQTVTPASEPDADRPRLRRGQEGSARDRRLSLPAVEHTEIAELTSPLTRLSCLQTKSLPQDFQASDRQGCVPSDQGRRASLPPSIPTDKGRRGSLPVGSGRRGSLQYPLADSPGADFPKVRRGSVQESPRERRQSLAVPVPDQTFDTSDDENRPSYLRERRGSLRRPSVKASEEGAADAAEDTRRLQQLYNQAIQTVQAADTTVPMGDPHLGSCTRCPKPRRPSDPGAPFDIAALKELENILNDARNYSARKPTTEDHYRHDVCSNRAQKKRIQHLEQALNRLNHDWEAPEIDPEKVLQCSYLRLSKSNVQTLEEMIRQRGNDPGIHIHTDLTGIDIWKGLREERLDLIKAAEEAAAEEAARKERSRRAKRGSIVKI